MNKFIKKLSFKTLNAILIFLIVGIFLLIFLFCYQSLRRIDTDEYWEIHSYQVQGNLTKLISDLENMETSQRGYVITGQESFLEPYTANLPDVSVNFQALQGLTSDNTTQQQYLSQMKPLIAAKFADLKNSISLRTNLGFSVAQADVMTDKGKVLMDSIRAIVLNMQTVESNLLQVRTKDLAQTNSIAELIIIWGSILGFIFYLFVNYIINNFVIGKIVKKSLLIKEQQANKIIESVNKELQALNLAKDEFVSIASHQLRTPLTALNGYTGMLLDEDVGPINDKQREYLGEIKKSNDRMIKLITSLLNVSRVDLGVFTVDPEPVNFKEVAESIIKELSSNIKDKNLQIKTNFEKDLPVLNADPKIIRMIFQNLLSNAVKYTPPEGNISLNIKKSDTLLLVAVTDTGCGIPTTEQSRIFTKLFRADNARVKDPTGTGLGLYIIKETIEQTGGKIWFESKENQGSTFYVSIPLEGMKKKEGSKRLEE